MLIPEQGKVEIEIGRPMKGIKGHNEHSWVKALQEHENIQKGLIGCKE